MLLYQFSLNFPCHKIPEMPGHGGMESLEQHKAEVFSGNAKSTGLHFNIPAGFGVFSPKEAPQSSISAWKFGMETKGVSASREMKILREFKPDLAPHTGSTRKAPRTG